MNHHGCLINKARFDTLNLSRGMAAAACLGFFFFFLWIRLLFFSLGPFIKGVFSWVNIGEGRVCVCVCVAFDKL